MDAPSVAAAASPSAKREAQGETESAELPSAPAQRRRRRAMNSVSTATEGYDSSASDAIPSIRFKPVEIPSEISD